jgi:hypothetical protein
MECGRVRNSVVRFDVECRVVSRRGVAWRGVGPRGVLSCRVV